tara:strand:+ start:454 stop:822 length:369 start_codon:yes stop_codon:yes gene_type:complete
MTGFVLSNLPYKTKSERKSTDAHIQWLRSNLDQDHCINKIRARGARKKWAIKNGLHARAYDQDLPMEYAEKVSVYVALKNKIRETEWLQAQRSAMLLIAWDIDTRITATNEKLDKRIRGNRR